MTPVRLLLMCLVLLGAGFGLWKLADQSGANSVLIELPEKVESPMMKGDLAMLERFTIEQPRYGTLLRLELLDGQWMMTEPLLDFPEPMAISFALKVFFGDDWEPAPEDWSTQTPEELGLAPAAATFELLYSDGSRETLRIGAKEETGRWRVAERNGELFRFPISPFRQLTLHPEQWRDHRMQPFGVNVDRLVWTPVEGEPIELMQQRSKWYVRKPFSGPLDETAFLFLMQMLGWRVDSMGAVPKSETVLNHPLGTLQLYQGSSKVELVVHSDGILSSHRDFPISYSKRAFRFLELSTEELRSRKVLDLDADQISSIQVEYGDEKMVFWLRNGDWVESESSEINAEQSTVVKALLEYGALLERGEEVALPEGKPSGRILFSISRTPRERGSTILCWWLGEDGSNLVAPFPATEASVSSVNFELGVRDLFSK